MNIKTTEGMLAIIAALLVLFSAMWDPRLALVVSIIALVALGIYQTVKMKK
jgi:4-hydroxybenzoate polyprenyltransferase